MTASPFPCPSQVCKLWRIQVFLRVSVLQHITPFKLCSFSAGLDQISLGCRRPWETQQELRVVEPHEWCGCSAQEQRQQLRAGPAVVTSHPSESTTSLHGHTAWEKASKHIWQWVVCSLSTPFLAKETLQSTQCICVCFLGMVPYCEESYGEKKSHEGMGVYKILRLGNVYQQVSRLIKFHKRSQKLAIKVFYGDRRAWTCTLTLFSPSNNETIHPSGLDTCDLHRL